MATTEIRCPKCGSNQITASKKGFSGKKAIAGAILTGGLGLIAGTIGSNKVKITCLACGKEFKPGEGKTVIIHDTQKSATNQSSSVTSSSSVKLTSSSTSSSSIKLTSSSTSLLSLVDQRIIQICEQNDLLSAVKYYKDLKDLDSNTAKEYVDKIVLENGVKVNVNKLALEKGGCFVATACYDNYDSPQVLVLRKYRDERLLKTFLGAIFVKIYYAVSPFFAKLISKSDLPKKIIRKYFLNPIVKKLQEKNDFKKRR